MRCRRCSEQEAETGVLCDACVLELRRWASRTRVPHQVSWWYHDGGSWQPTSEWAVPLPDGSVVREYRPGTGTWAGDRP